MPLLLLVLWTLLSLSHQVHPARFLLSILRRVVAAEFLLLLGLALLGLIYQRTMSARGRRLYPPPGKLVDLGGYRLHLYCRGEGGPTVILDYGLVGSFLDWYFVQPEVARFARVCSYDRGGYGWSERSPRPRLARAMAEELHTLLAKAGEEPPFLLVGHSAGGFDALMYAHLYPEQVAGLVLVDGAHPDGDIPFPWRRRLWLRLMESTAPFGLPRWRGWCRQGPVVLRARKAACNCFSRVYRTYYEQWRLFPKSASQVRELGSLGASPLVVISRDPHRPHPPGDPLWSANELRWQELQKQLAALSSQSTHLIASGSGHDVISERPEVVVEAIRQILERIRHRPQAGRD